MHTRSQPTPEVRKNPQQRCQHDAGSDLSEADGAGVTGHSSFLYGKKGVLCAHRRSQQTPQSPKNPQQGEVLVTGYEGTEATCIPTATPTTAHRTLQRAHSHPKLKNKTSEDRRGAKKSSGPGQRGRQGSYGVGRCRTSLPHSSSPQSCRRIGRSAKIARKCSLGSIKSLVTTVLY